MDVADRLQILATAAGCSMRDLDEIAGRTQGHAQAIIRRTIAAPTAAVLDSYADALLVSRVWLARGEGQQPDLDDVRVTAFRACAVKLAESKARDASKAGAA